MTTVKFKDGSDADFKYGSDLVKLFLERVPDRNTRSMLFGFYVDCDPDPEDIDFSGYDIIVTMKRIVSAAFVISLCRWKQVYDDKDWGEEYEEERKFFENARFTKLFQSALSNEDITFDLKIFALMELWVGLKDAPGHVCYPFDMLFERSRDDDSIGITLQQVRDAVKNVTFKRNGNPGKYTAEYLNELCFRLLKSFMVFSGATVEYPADNRLDDDRDFCIAYRLSYTETVTLYPNEMYRHGKLVATEQQLLLMSGKTDVRPPDALTLFTLSETTAFDGKLQNKYASFDGEYEIRVVAEDRASEISSGATPDDLREIRKFLSFNYKNIREFAVIITDAVKNSSSVTKKLLDICKSNANLQSCCSVDGNSPNLYWDNIITLMLVEIGVSDFLEKILADDNDSIFKSIMNNIGRRCVKKSEVAALVKACKEEEEKIRNRRHIKPAAVDAQILELRVRTVLSAMNPVEKDDDPNPFEESLSYKYNNMSACLDVMAKTDGVSMNELGECVNTLSDIFKNIFDFLQIFYVGLNKYSEHDQSYNFVPSPADGEISPQMQWMRRHRSCIRAFTDAASAKYKRIKDGTLVQSFKGFCEMCKSYNNFSDGSALNASEEAQNLKYLITRNYICDVEKLEFFATIKLANGETSTIFDMLENFSIKYSNDPSYREWLNYFKDIFMFLIYNEDYNARGLYRTENELEDKDCDPVYPYIVTYYKENVDRDNLKKCTYRVPIPTARKTDDEHGTGLTVTLLTEADYPPNTYFCIPLRYGSSKSWWINPFLIPKRFVQRIFQNENNNDK